MNQMIDPMTGLPLQTLTPAPAMSSVNAVGGANWPSQPMPTASPAISDAMTVPVAATPMANSMAEIGPSGAASGSEPALKKSSLLDKALFTLFGTPDSMLDDDAKAKKEGNRMKAGELSKSAAEQPGKAFMGIPSSGSDSLGDSIGKILTTLFG